MSSGAEYEVGRGRPPVASRWKSGQSGNPRGRRIKQVDISGMIDDFLVKQIKITESRAGRRVTQFEAILLQLANKALTGNRRASNVMLKYLEYAVKRGGPPGTILVVRDDETGSGK